MSTPHQEPTSVGSPAPGAGAPAGPPEGRRPAPKGRSALGSVRLVLLGATVVVIVVLAVLNTDATTLNYLFGEAQVSLLAVIAISALLGAIVGAAAVWRAKS